MENPYNRVAYKSVPFPQAHINRLASMATLLGMSPPPVSGCRVLELGCGDGTHLIPMAMEYPESQFVGIDLADRPIAKATDLAEELGLENISFRVADIQQLNGQPGECDYLIAHGVYSWVPPAVQNKVLELCGHLLAPSGIAYVSYNAYPAWHIREMTRNMVRIHTEGIDEPGEIRNRAIALLASIYRSQGETDPYRETIRSEMERIIGKDACLCFHDDFGEHNYPIYFREFMRRAAAVELQFLSESEPADMQTSDIPPDVREALTAMTNIEEREQYYDLLTCRGFRRTLLCRQGVVLDRSISADRLRTLHFAASLKLPETGPDLVTMAPTEFFAHGGSSITVTQPFVKVVLYELAQAWPGSRSFEELLERARSVAPLLSTEESETMLREVLLRMHSPRLMELSVHPWRFAARPGEKPRASRLARMQIRNGSRVTSLRHRPVEIEDPLQRAVLPLLDGTREIERLKADAAQDMSREVTEDEVRAALQSLSHHALLEA